MARITFKNPNDHLSGTLCGLVYKNRNGKNFVYSQPEPVLPKRPTKEQRLKYRKDCVVQNCVSLIQSDMLDRRKLSIPEMQRVADMHNAIRTTVCRWYDYYRPYFKTDFALEKAIVYYYHTKNLPPQLALFEDELPMQKIQAAHDKLSAMTGSTPDNGSRMARE